VPIAAGLSSETSIFSPVYVSSQFSLLSSHDHAEYLSESFVEVDNSILHKNETFEQDAVDADEEDSVEDDDSNEEQLLHNLMHSSFSDLMIP
jgi:hypothetical protein